MSARRSSASPLYGKIALGAQQLFREKGYDATTVEMIAERAGVSPRTVFNYFPSKADMFFADRNGLRSALLDMAASRHLHGRSLEGVVEVIVSWCSRIEHDREKFADTVAIVLGSEDLQHTAVALSSDTVATLVTFLEVADQTPVERQLLWAACASTVFSAQGVVRAWVQDEVVELTPTMKRALSLVSRAFQSVLVGNRATDDTFQY